MHNLSKEKVFSRKLPETFGVLGPSHKRFAVVIKSLCSATQSTAHLGLYSHHYNF